MNGPARLAVEDASQVPLARQLAAEAARDLGFRGPAVDTIALAATELAQNLHLHANGGELVVVPGPWQGGGTHDLAVVALDRGPGVADFDRCLHDGYSTTGTMGTGLGAVRRLAAQFDAVSEPGRGTVVRALFHHGGSPAHAALTGFDLGAVGFPVAGETVNGDGWTAVAREEGIQVLLADGLGHGWYAAEASTAAVDALTSVGGAPGDFLTRAAPLLAGTRGAAVTVAFASLVALRNGGTILSAGLGNVSLLVAGPDGAGKRVATSHGTLGSGPAATPVETRTPLQANGILVLHTDGLSSRWDVAGRSELLRRPAGVIAAALWRDHARGTDDSLVVVIKASAPRES